MAILSEFWLLESSYATVICILERSVINPWQVLILAILSEFWSLESSYDTVICILERYVINPWQLFILAILSEFWSSKLSYATVICILERYVIKPWQAFILAILREDFGHKNQVMLQGYVCLNDILLIYDKLTWLPRDCWDFKVKLLLGSYGTKLNNISTIMNNRF